MSSPPRCHLPSGGLCGKLVSVAAIIFLLVSLVGPSMRTGESLSLEELKAVLSLYNLAQPEQAIITVMRKLSRDGAFEIQRFCDELHNPTDEEDL